MDFARLNGKRCSEEERSKRAKHVRGIVIPHTQYQEVWRELSRTHMDGKSSVNPKGMFISGDTGVGKTTIFRKYLENHPREELSTYTRIPVLYIKTPSPARNTKAMATEILFRMGDPFYHVGTEQVQTTRICGFVEKCQIDMIIIDELQHLIDRDTNKLMASVSDWVKRLAEAISIPIVLCGLPESERIFKYNPQLDDRCSNRLFLTPFRYETEGEKSYFKKFLDEVDKALPFQDRSYISEYSERIYYATLGITRQVMTLLENATKHAALSGSDKICFEHLDWGYQDIKRTRRPFAENPFVGSFNLTESTNKEQDKILTKHQQDSKNGGKGKGDADRLTSLSLYHLIMRTHVQHASTPRKK